MSLSWRNSYVLLIDQRCFNLSKWSRIPSFASYGEAKACIPSHFTLCITHVSNNLLHISFVFPRHFAHFGFQGPASLTMSIVICNTALHRMQKAVSPDTLACWLKGSAEQSFWKNRARESLQRQCVENFKPKRYAWQQVSAEQETEKPQHQTCQVVWWRR